MLIGTTYGSKKQGATQCFFTGTLDEIRISNTARSSFTTTAFTSSAQTVQNAAAALTEDVATWAGFVTSETLNGGTITYRLSTDGGTVWQYWDGDSWETSASTSSANSAADINTNIETLAVTSSGIKWQAILDGDGTQQVTLDSVAVEANSDTTNPTPPSSATALNQSGGGISLTTDRKSVV